MNTVIKWDKIFSDLSLDNSAKANTIYLKFKDQVFGPILPEELHEYLQYLKDENIYFRQEHDQEDNWQSIVSHPLFQRRRPENISKESLPEQYIAYLLKNGQKVGPYNQDEVFEQVTHLKYLITDFISIDHGKTWKKLCDYHNFDRRLYQNNHLPFTLEGKAPITIESEITHKGTEEEIAKVAFQEHQHHNIIKAAKDNLSYSQNLDNTSVIAPYQKLLLVLVAFIGLSFFMYSILGSKIQQSSTKYNQQNTKKLKSSQVFKPKIKSRDNKLMNRIPAKTNNIQKSILKSTIFKNRHKTGESSGKFDQIDEPAHPYEQDPVQRMLSKETIYPEDFEDINEDQESSDIPEEDDWVKRLEDQNIRNQRSDQYSDQFEESLDEEIDP